MNSENIYMRDCYWRGFDDSKPVGVSMKIGNGYFFRGVGGCLLYLLCYGWSWALAICIGVLDIDEMGDIDGIERYE